MPKNSLWPFAMSINAADHVRKDAFWIEFEERFDQQALLTRLLSNHHPRIQLRHEFWESLNAVSVQVKDEAVLHELLNQIQGIRLIEPVVEYDRPEAIDSHQSMGASTSFENPKLMPHRLTGVQQVHDSLKIFGKGIKVGIIDSGVDYTHPALGGCFGPGCKVAYGYDFVGDDGQSPDHDPTSDCSDHGTHVAGIIAANDTRFLGVAPQVTLGAYRVFSCKGKTANDVVIKALLRAVKDGMQVINLSLGSPGGWRQERETRLVDRLSRNSTIIVAAAGNEGRSGMFEVVSPGVAGSAIQVASLENPFMSAWYFQVQDSPSQGMSAFINLIGLDLPHSADSTILSKETELPETKTPRQILFKGDRDMPWSNTTLVQVARGTSGKVNDDACQLIDANLKGKIALIRRGGCTFKDKIANAVRAKASGIIFMNNVDDPSLSVDTKGSPIKTCTISLSDGEYLLRAIKFQKRVKEGIRLVAGKEPRSFKNPKAGLPSVFTSPGPDAELNMKPDIAAPGGNIWSTVPVKMGSYGSKSGTSMATPYVTGCVALYLQGLPKADHSAEAVKRALQNYAKPIMDGKGFQGYASVAEQGAGIVNMMGTLLGPVELTPFHLALNDSSHILPRQSVAITNNGKTTVTYKIDLVPAVGLIPFLKNNTVALDPKRTQADTWMVASKKSIRIAPESTSKVDIGLTGPKLDLKDFSIYSGFLRFTPESVTQKTPVLSVPFVGMQGDYKSLPILDEYYGLRVVDDEGRPLSSKSSSCDARDSKFAIKEKSDGDGNDNDKEQLGIMYRLFTSCRLLVLDLVSVEGSDPYKVQSYGLLSKGVARYVPRNDNSDKNTAEVMEWDGKILDKHGKPAAVPKKSDKEDIQYRIRISLLKHFGDTEKDEDFESHLSQPFTMP
ncbi:hypothetical protein BGZ83_005428 [Gryganskiella cystojenkinii]|nr:hypothetical protein BGZ83_005428 [Gryganskiella cystojenkinii]